MNIFVVHQDPQIAAQMLCDKHVVKMILETAQMLCTVVSHTGAETPYRATHAKHPCTLWAAHSKANWEWLVAHGKAMCMEYTRRVVCWPKLSVSLTRIITLCAGNAGKV